MKTQRKGFALILAIVAMAFMVMLTLTLSSIISAKLRLLTAQKESRMARSNALLGLNAAVSSLQSTLGKDNAVSANATILDTDPKTIKIDGVATPYVVGAFKVEKDAEDMTVKEWQDEHVEIGQKLRYGEEVDADKVEWLISSTKKLTNPQSQSITDLNSEVVKIATYKMLETCPAEEGNFGGKVSRDQKSEEVQVLAGKIDIQEGNAYAWWVSDESQKAKINLMRPKTYLDNQKTGEASDFKISADRFIPQVSNIGFLDELSNYQLNPFIAGYDEERAENLAKMTSLDEFAIIDSQMGNWAKENKGDYTTTSMGIPVDVTQAKLKEDLTSYIFRNSKGLKDTDEIIRGGPNDKKYTGPKLGIKNYTQNLPRFGLLKGYATVVSDVDDGKLNFNTGIEAKGLKTTVSETQYGVFPIISAVTWYFQLAHNGYNSDGTVSFSLFCYPRVKIWNPHNVTLKRQDYYLRLNFPFVLQMGMRVVPGVSKFAFEDLSASVLPQNLKPGFAKTYENNYAVAMFVAVNESSGLKKLYFGRKTKGAATDPVEVGTKAFDSKTYKETGELDYQPKVPLYKMNGGSIQNGGLTVDFADILVDRMLPKGSGVHSEGTGSVKGTPAVTMRIPNLELKPGENVELNLNGNFYTYDKSAGSSDGKFKKGGNYPELKVGNIIQTNYIKRGGGAFEIILSDGNGSINSVENVKIQKSPYNTGYGTEQLMQMTDTEMQNADLVGLWNVIVKSIEAYNKHNNNEPKMASHGYELYNANGEYLTSSDQSYMENAGSQYVGYKEHPIYYQGSNHNTGREITYPSDSFNMFWEDGGTYGYFAANDTRDNNLFDKNVLYYPIDKNARGYGNYNGGANYTGYLKSGTWNAANGDFRYNLPPIIPRISELKSGDLMINGTGSGVAQFGNNKKFVMRQGKATAKGIATNWNMYSGQKGNKLISSTYDLFSKTSTSLTTPAWHMDTLAAPKRGNFAGSSINSAGGDQPDPPMLMMNSNFLRDTGEALRPYAPHGTIASFQSMGQCVDNNNCNEARYFFFRPKSEISDSNWPTMNGMSTKKWDGSEESKNDNAWAWQGNYDGDMDRLYCIPLIDADGNKKAVGDHKQLEWSPIITVFDYPRSEDQVLSLGIFSHANLSTMLWQPTFPFGSSRPSPFIKRESLIDTEDQKLYENELIDMSYLLNYSMWDRFYLSTMPKSEPSDIFAGMRLQNTRNIITVAPDEKRELVGDDAFEKSAKFVGIDGAFNVNSTSYEAWRALLGALLGTKKQSLLEDDYPKKVSPSDPKSFYMPNPGNINTLLHPTNEEAPFGYRDVAAGRNFSEADIDRLAYEIVAEVKRRAPFFSLAEFVNRRLISYSDSKSDEDLRYQSMMGTIAAAIERASEEYDKTSGISDINTFHTDADARPYSAKDVFNVSGKNFARYPTYKGGWNNKKEEFAEHEFGTLFERRFQRFMGFPGYYPMQSQILQAIAPVITPRGDTFTVRSYGEYKNPMTGNTAKAYCEAVVQRVATPVNPTDDVVQPKGEFGRRFKIVSFKWLTPNEL